MTPRRFLIAFLSVALAACTTDIAQNPDPNHTHVDFAVWINGEQVDFSKPEYMSDHVDGEEEPEGEHEDEGHKHPYLHLHDGNGHVLHRHKPGLAIGDFFTSIGFTMTESCFTNPDGEAFCNDADSGQQWRMFVNGEEWPMNPAYDFADLDAILLTYGGDDTEMARELDGLPDDACLYSKTCPERGDPPIENCIADPAVPCTVAF